MLGLKSPLLAILIILSLQSSYSFSQVNVFVTTKGSKIIDPHGKELLLKGINLGNWLEPEGYMFKFQKAESSRKIYEVYNEIIGPDASIKFWEDFRKDYINENDIKFIKDIGFNSVRIPFDYKLLVHEDFSANCDPPGYKLLDNVIKWCTKYKIYANS